MWAEEDKLIQAGSTKIDLTAGQPLQATPRVLLALVEVGAGVGGIENVGRSLIRLLAGKQCEGILDYRVVSLRGPRNETDSKELRQWAAERLVHFDDRRGAFSISVLWQMISWADVVIFIHMGIASLLTLVPRWLRPLSMTWIYGVEVWSRPILRQRLGLARSDYVISISELTMHRAIAANPWLPLPWPCHLGIPSDEGAEPIDSLAQINFLPGPHDILIVGRLAKGEGRKGHDQLIAAMGEVARVTSDARLIVAGAGDNLDFYKEMARREGVTDRVVFTGFLHERVLAEL